MTRILGISCYFHDAAAALLEDNKLIAAAEEERFSRIKHDFSFPSQAIDFCLSKGGLVGKDLDYVVFFEKPFTKFDRLLQTAMHGFPKTYWMFVQSMRTWLTDKLWIKSHIAKSIGIDANKILFSDHHLSHAASAYFCSPFQESAILTFDGVGEKATTTMGIGHDNQIDLTHEIRFPHSIGLLYSAFTAFLGFEVNEGEYKVMGMAAYGTPRYLDHVWQVVDQSSDGSFSLNPEYFAFHYSTNRSYSGKFKALFGEPRDPRVPFFTESSGFPTYYGDRPHNFAELTAYNQYYADLAASLQLVTEELMLGIANEIWRQTGIPNLCLAGGVALNSVANGRILRETPFEQLYIQPSAGDGGAALGAALVGWHCEAGGTERLVMDHAYWGQEYPESAILDAIGSVGAKSFHVDEDQKLVDLSVDQLENGKVLGWFQGRFEWGPRSLGNRSILADPRHDHMKDLVNTKIKFREPFRPFAPSVLAHRASEYFDLPGEGSNMPARFMTLVVPVKDDKRDQIAAVNHMGTARLQTVYEAQNKKYYDLIETFGDATGTPLLMNTSFNVRGEPIVSTPLDALNTFFNSGLDTLVIGNEVIEK